LAGAALVQSGMVVGLGSGTTSTLMINRLGERIQEEGLKFTAVATSIATADLARSLKIPLYELDDVVALDISLDGADEIDRQFRMIKGRGGALLHEKIVACASNHRVTLIVADKWVQRLGVSMPVPVEVSTVGVKHTARRLEQLGATTTIRRGDLGSEYLTDGGNAILDCHFGTINDPAALDREIQTIAGVLETGLFIDLCDTLIVGSIDGAQQIESGARTLVRRQLPS
jgi:ribose 5-phosphate isomerase A